MMPLHDPLVIEMLMKRERQQASRPERAQYLPHPARVARSGAAFRQGRRLLAGLGALLIALGQGLQRQTLPPVAPAGEQAAGRT